PHNAFVTDIENFRKDPERYPLPRFMFYTPNLDDDGHDPSLRPQVGLKKSSKWLGDFLQTWFPWQDQKLKGTLLVITYDESQGYEPSNHIYTVFLGDMVKSGEVSKAYNHFDILRTIEDNFGLSPLQQDGDGKGEVITDIWK
ncbi:MAG TPA: alkaline phosphatase family protein, partial [Candidatus Acidoferrales bacterium]|nr:alkaline phosphatase family protein [Candidatus Acidoferrales bacterium]